MNLMAPSKRKFRKCFKGRIKGLETRGFSVSFGSFGLRATEAGRVQAKQIEAARRAVSRSVKRSGKVWIRIFPDVPVSRKPLEMRMGGGKGAVDFWVAKVRPGRILFEIDGTTEAAARAAFALAASKLPVSSKFVTRVLKV